MKILIRYAKELAFLLILTAALFYFGVFTQLLETDFKYFKYPYEGDIEPHVTALRLHLRPSHPPPYTSHFRHLHAPLNCSAPPHLVLLIKSAPAHRSRRDAIRRTWGRPRFSDVPTRTVFLLGAPDGPRAQRGLDREAEAHADLLQADFVDAYFNNTRKTMLGFAWAAQRCPRARFYLFADDDYYVSVKNVLRFVRSPTTYPRLTGGSSLDANTQLYAGFVLEGVGPIRARSSKWYVPLDEYEYSVWPRYVTAGAYVVSWESLVSLYYGSFYTKHFRFDDIYLALVALKCRIVAMHSEYFYFYKAKYDRRAYKDVVASHGYGDEGEMERVWNEQREAGNA